VTQYLPGTAAAVAGSTALVIANEVLAIETAAVVSVVVAIVAGIAWAGWRRVANSTGPPV
jgi:hypothetical protein